MGRRTFESIGRALPGRLNIVLTRDSNYKVPEGVAVTSSIDSAIELAKASGSAESSVEDIFIIGGGEIYRQSMPLIEKEALSNSNPQRN